MSIKEELEKIFYSLIDSSDLTLGFTKMMKERYEYNKKVLEDFNNEKSDEFKYGDLFLSIQIKERYLPMVIPNKKNL